MIRRRYEDVAAAAAVAAVVAVIAAVASAVWVHNDWQEHSR